MGCNASSGVFEVPAGKLEAPPDLAAYVAAAKERLARGEAVLPCQHTGLLHGNWAGRCRGFSSPAALGQYNDMHLEEIRGIKGDILEHWQALDVDFVLQNVGQAGAATPSARELRPRIRETLAMRFAMYQKALWSMPRDELCRIKAFDSLWPCSSAEELRQAVLQPEEATTVRLTYAAGASRLELLYLFTLGLARSVGETAKQVQWSVKRPLRLWRKSAESFPEDLAKNDLRRCGDVYRTSLTVGSLAQVERVLQILESLGRHAPNSTALLESLGLGGCRPSFVVERIKNRFVSPCIGGYMDLAASLRIDGYVTELQVQLRHLAELKGESGRRAYKWFRAFRRNADEYAGERTADGRMHGAGTLCPLAGGRYRGEFENGKRHGRGIFYHANGDRYEGNFINGKKHGAGAYYYASGDRYRGGFLDDRMHGTGTYYCADGERFEGEYMEGKRHGTGAYHYRNGTCLQGEWWHNKYVTVVGV